MKAPEPHAIDRVVGFLRDARSALVITGAGISADSGLPTYRGVGGLYEEADTEDGIPIEVALSGQMLRRRPEVAWRHIHRIAMSCRGASFNSGHAIIARLEERLDRVCVLTQNVDGFHRDAGSTNVIEIHGNVRSLSCTACPHAEDVEDYASIAIPPMCSRCGAVLRPDVVLFGEMLPDRAVDALEREVRRGFDVVFSVGTTSVFPYIAQPVVYARMGGVPTVEVNPGETEVSHLVDVRLRCGAKAAFEAIWAAWTEEA